MKQMIVSQITEIPNPKIKAIAERVVATARLAMEKAGAHEAAPGEFPLASGGIEAVMARRLAQLSPERRKVAAVRSLASVRAAPATRTAALGDLAEVDLKAPTPIDEQVQALRLPPILRLQPGDLQIIEPNRVVLPPAAVMSAPLKSPTTLEFRILSVTCVEKTTEPGQDSISLGGVTVNEKGETGLVSAFGVGEFSSGTSVDFGPPRVFATFNLSDAPEVGWPRSYFVTLVLAERDYGGFPSFLQDLWNMVRDALVKELTKAGLAAVGTVVGGPVGGSIGAAIGSVVTAAIGWVVDKVFATFRDIWSDDIFKAVPLQCHANNPDLFWDPSGDWTEQGDIRPEGGGQYTIRYEWSYERPSEPRATTLALASWAPKRLDVFVRGTSMAVCHRAFEGDHWTGWDNISGNCASGPAAVSWGPGRLDVFVRGLDRQLFLRSFENGWNDWHSLGGHCTSAPAACSWAPRRLDVFVRNELFQYWHRSWQGVSSSQGTWTDWDSVGGLFGSAPACVSWGPGRIDLFGTSLNGILMHRYYVEGQDWSSWSNELGKPPGGPATSAPSVCSWEPGRLDVFVRGADKGVWHRAWERDHWTGWDTIGGKLTSAPACVSWAPGRIDVVGRGLDSALWHTAYDRSSGWSDWTGVLGGVLT